MPICRCAACDTVLYETVHPASGLALTTDFPAGRLHGEGDRYYLVCPGCNIEIDFRLDEMHGPNMMAPARAGTVNCN
jgi:hypothetical protein